MTVVADLVEQVRAAAAHATPLVIRSGASKGFLGRGTAGTPLVVSGLRGIVHYEPTELVITAQAGTPLAEIETALAERGQMIGFEPPHYGPAATLGGTIACGLSGPARPFRGSARDFVLGTKLINGNGESLTFGGEVMKNVAGYDVSRLMCGAYGTLGVLLEISLKVLPRPASELTLALECAPDTAFAKMSDWQRAPLPLSALCYDGNRLLVRLSGAEHAVTAARCNLGGEVLADGATFWTDLREQRTAFFSAPGDLWRLSVPSTTPAIGIPGREFIDWGGALRWLKTTQNAASVFAAADAAGGHATHWRGTDTIERLQPLPAPLLGLHRRLKQAFDPHGLFNPGRLYPEF